jgi:small conductance mechanosensitive channel
MASLLWAGRSAISSRLARTRAEFSEATDAAARALERALGVRERRMNLIDDVILDHVLAMERVGLDASADRDSLTSAVDRRAAILSARIGFLNHQIGQYQEQMGLYPGDTIIGDQSRSAEIRKKFYVECLDAAVKQLQKLDRPTARYQSVLVRNTGDLSKSLADPAVASTLLRDAWAEIRAWLADNGVGVFLKALFFFVILALSWAVARVVRRAVEHGLNGPRIRISHLLRKMIVSFSGTLVLMAGLLVALSQLGVNLSPILAGFGVVGFIVGFALQDTLGNFAAGMMILFYRPYDVGDFVEVSGVFGKVSHMNLVSTTILTIDNQTLVIPNGKIWGDVIRNVTSQRIRRVDLTFGISYSDDIPKAEKILMSILEDHDKVLPDPEPLVRLHQLGESSVDFVVRPWVRTDDYWDVYWDVTREVKMRFDAEGVSIPFPQRDVHHYVDGRPALPRPDGEGPGPAARSARGLSDDPSPPDE